MSLFAAGLVFMFVLLVGVFEERGKL